MTETETLKIDKTGWGDGPWQHEPDRIEFRHHGYPCLIRRHPSLGHLCGYVAVPPGHPWHGQQPDEADVHGGLTYADACHLDVCHVPEPGESDAVWWLGFDAAHLGFHTCDLSPGLLPELRTVRDAMHLDSAVYRDVDYMRGECVRLVEQAEAAAAAA